MKNLENLFKNIENINPNPELENLILQKIENVNQKQIQQKLISSYIYMFGSVMLLIYSSVVFGGEILQSEFWSLASLFFSDLKTVLVNWQNFGYSLLETFPVIGAVAILIPVFIFTWSLAVYFDWHAKISHHIYGKKSFA